MQKLWRMESMDEPEKHYSVEILFKLIQCKYIIGQRIIYYGQRFNIRSPFVLFLTLILFFCSFFIFLMRLSEKSFFFFWFSLYSVSSTDSNPEANNFFQHFCSEILSPSSTKRLCTPFPDFPCNCGLDIFFFFALVCFIKCKYLCAP